MPRCRWLWHINDLHEIVDTDFTSLEEVENPQSRLIRKGSELQVGSIVGAARHVFQRLDILLGETVQY